MKYSIVYGGIAGAIAIAVICASLGLDMPHSELFGYLVMFASLSLIYLGVKRYRDVERGGAIGFGGALLSGLGMAAAAGVVYVIGWELFTSASGYDFMTNYTNSVLAGMRQSGASAAAIDAKAAELQQMATLYGNPLIRIPMVFVEIFPVGVIVALISAALLRTAGKSAASAPAA